MIFMLSTVTDDPAIEDTETNKKGVNITDILGLGKVTQSLAHSFGKLIEKIPSQKLSPIMAYLVIMTIMYVGLFVFLIHKNPPNLPLFMSWITIFFLIIIVPFIFLEVNTNLVTSKVKAKKNIR